MSTLHIVKTDGSNTTEPFPAMFDYDRDNKRMREIVGGDIEFVWVEYEGQRTCMIVNETGAIQSPPLPVNEWATRIYHTWPAKRDGLTLEQARDAYPTVHGDVALLENVAVL